MAIQQGSDASSSICIACARGGGDSGATFTGAAGTGAGLAAGVGAGVVFAITGSAERSGHMRHPNSTSAKATARPAITHGRRLDDGGGGNAAGEIRSIWWVA